MSYGSLINPFLTAFCLCSSNNRDVNSDSWQRTVKPFDDITHSSSKPFSILYPVYILLVHGIICRYFFMFRHICAFFLLVPLVCTLYIINVKYFVRANELILFFPVCSVWVYYGYTNDYIDYLRVENQKNIFLATKHPITVFKSVK